MRRILNSNNKYLRCLFSSSNILNVYVHIKAVLGRLPILSTFITGVFILHSLALQRMRYLLGVFVFLR